MKVVSNEAWVNILWDVRRDLICAERKPQQGTKPCPSFHSETSMDDFHLPASKNMAFRAYLASSALVFVVNFYLYVAFLPGRENVIEKEPILFAGLACRLRESLGIACTTCIT